MKIGLVIASHGRPVILQQVMTHLLLQRRVPDEIVISAVGHDDISAAIATDFRVRSVFGSVGLTCQRNRGISCLIDTADVIAFIDDDFLVGDDYFLNMERIFEQDDSIVGVNGEIIADGANSPGFTFEEGLRLGQQYRLRKTMPVTRELSGRYAEGCNGIIACRTANIGSIRFDEPLPLYGWQEDLDFCGALRRSGRLVRTNLVWGIHLRTKRGKGSEVRTRVFTGCQSSLYCSGRATCHLPMHSNWLRRTSSPTRIKSIRPESYVDRRGRLRGNFIGMFHLMTGRLTPEYILKLK